MRKLQLEPGNLRSLVPNKDGPRNVTGLLVGLEVQCMVKSVALGT